MTGARKSREEADRFFAAQAIQIGCRLVSELTDGDDFPSAVVFSVMRRDIFAKLIDPWPSKNIVFAGYDFEIDVYKQRLRWRATRKRKLELAPEARTSLTSYASGHFASAPTTASPLPNDETPGCRDQGGGFRSRPRRAGSGTGTAASPFRALSPASRHRTPPLYVLSGAAGCQ